MLKSILRKSICNLEMHRGDNSGLNSLTVDQNRIGGRGAGTKGSNRLSYREACIGRPSGQIWLLQDVLLVWTDTFHPPGKQSLLVPTRAASELGSEMKAASRDGISNQECLGTHGSPVPSWEPGINQARSQRVDKRRLGSCDPRGRALLDLEDALQTDRDQGDRELTRAGLGRQARVALGLIASKSWDRKQLQVSLGLLGVTS